MKHPLILLTLFFGFVLSGCDSKPLSDGVKSEMDQLKNTTSEQQRALQELSNQVRALNEENNRLKSLMSQLTDGVVAQKQTLQNLTQAASVKPAPPAPKYTPKPVPKHKPTQKKYTAPKKSIRSTSKSSASRRTIPKPKPTKTFRR